MKSLKCLLALAIISAASASWADDVTDTRSVRCLSSTGEFVADNLCSTPKPDTTRTRTISCTGPTTPGECDNATLNSCANGGTALAFDMGVGSDSNFDRWKCNSPDGGSPSGQCEKAKTTVQTCTVGQEVEINHYDGGPGSGYDATGECVATNYMSPSNLYGNFINCTDSGSNPNSAKINGPNAGTQISSTQGCISRVWRNGTSTSNSTECRVFGYRCAVSTTAGACNNNTLNGCANGGAVFAQDSSDPNFDRWKCHSPDGGADSGQCEKAKTPRCSLSASNTTTVDQNGNNLNTVLNSCGYNSSNRAGLSYTYKPDANAFVICQPDINLDDQLCGDGITELQYNNNAECTQSRPACPSTPTTCTLGPEEELTTGPTGGVVISTWDGTPGQGFDLNAPESGPCNSANYIGAGTGLGESGFVSCTDTTGNNPMHTKVNGPFEGTQRSGKCISRVATPGGASHATANRCAVMVYRCVN